MTYAELYGAVRAALVDANRGSISFAKFGSRFPALVSKDVGDAKVGA